MSDNKKANSQPMPFYALHADTDMIDRRIKEILKQDKMVEFRHKHFPSLRKFVVEWNQDEEGDFTAIKSTGESIYVCAYAKDYEILPLDKEEFELEFGSVNHPDGQ